MSETPHDYIKEFQNVFNKLAYNSDPWRVWECLMTIFACGISNVVDRRPEVFGKRMDEYEAAVDEIRNPELIERLYTILVDALEENPNQDFLGNMYMRLKLNKHYRGQFFTAYSICRLMAMTTLPQDCQEIIKEQGYISILEPCLGSGAMLIASASVLREQGINYQQDALFVGQDIDPVVAKMAYIQLSLIGCAGYITVGDSLNNPQTGHPLFPIRKDIEQEIWIMPMFLHEKWENRREEVIKQLETA